jgi:glyceraldehyde-3-phosphate dehydrogenase/erythrose-4-phosphate dehydrogenase
LKPSSRRQESGISDSDYDPASRDVISCALSRDIIGDPASCVFDSGLTQAAGSLVRVFGWFDNEWGYTCRLVHLAALAGASPR